MTKIAGQFMELKQGADLDAMSYLVRSLSSIRSIYMLDILLGLLTEADRERRAP
jgi:hypothetical protein